MKKLIYYKSIIAVVVTLIAISGFINHRPAEIIRKICKGTSLELKGPSSYSVKWFKDGKLYASSQNIIVTEPGKYVVVSINEHGCDSEASDPVIIEVIDSPSSISISGNTKGCYMSTISLSANSSSGQNVEFEWFIKGQTQPFASGKTINHVIKKNEFIMVKTKGEVANCSTSAEVFVEQTSLTGDFTSDNSNINIGKKIKFTPSIPNAIKFEWDLGDGTKSNLESPEHLYKSSGLMTVKLKAYSAEGCTIEIIKNSMVNVGSSGGGEIIPPKGNEILIDENPFKFRIYPNPVPDHMLIELYAKNDQVAIIEYYSIDGKIIHRYEEKIFKGNNKIRAKSINLFTPNSNYIVRVRFDGKIEVFQIFKTK